MSALWEYRSVCFAFFLCFLNFDITKITMKNMKPHHLFPLTFCYVSSLKAEKNQMIFEKQKHFKKVFSVKWYLTKLTAKSKKKQSDECNEGIFVCVVSSSKCWATWHLWLSILSCSFERKLSFFYQIGRVIKLGAVNPATNELHKILEARRCKRKTSSLS